MNRRKFLKRGLLLGGGLLVSSYPFLIERYLIQINTYKIPIKNLPLEFNGFRILQLTDLHYGFLVPESLIDHVIEKANSLEKDIIVCTGDYIHEKHSTRQIDIVWLLLSKLKAKDGVFSVLGNHDHWGDFDRSYYWLKRSGQDLHHKLISIERSGKRIWLGGTGDLWEDMQFIDNVFQDVNKNECKILLAHNPDTADTYFETKIDLMISGHTHGGQVSIPFIGAPVLPVKNKKYSSGFINTEKTNIFISRGIGWAIMPIRLNCYPEISILQLYRE